MGGLVLLAVVLGMLGRRYLEQPAPLVLRQEPTIGEAKSQSAAKPSEVVVHVAGAVAKPGVLHLSSESRVQDAINEAGGAAQDADLEALNLAAKLVDGTQVFVPHRKPGTANQPAVGDEYVGGEQADSPYVAVQRAESSKSSTPGAGSISLNTSGMSELERLPGVGPATAQKIIEYRKEHGGFTSIDEVMAVRGIGPKKLEAMRKYLRL